ncbi:MAG: energy-coupling factor transporter transmembrane protein EcfT [Clostridia bacterium]|nr:energy-coupling factor transporter transmembrane protein EcfT [Clostridia bacterium]
MELTDAIKIGIRLIMVCHMTYLFSKTTTAMQMAKAIQKLLYPLKWFGVNIKNIGIMVSLSITFIPIIKKEIENIRYSLMAKGFDMRLVNQIKHIDYIMGPLFYSLLRKVSQLEDALKSKAYVEE